MNIQSPTDAPLQGFDLGAMVLDALAQRPEAGAFRFQEATLSRGGLREAAWALAARLREAGLKPGAAVALEIEHSLDLPIAMCAIQMAQACAIPIDPHASAARREAILADICPEFILRRDPGLDPSIVIERGPEQAGQRPELDPDLAFVVYTSGSSGGPKGVMITRESYVRRMQLILPSFTPLADDVDLAWTPSSFTVMVDEMFLPILSGMVSVIAPPALRSDPRGLADLVARTGVTNLRLTPSVLDLLLRTGVADALSQVRTLVCSGEAMPADLQVRAHAALPANLLGFYGATEAPAVAFIPYDRTAEPLSTTICTPQPFVDLKIMQDATVEAPLGTAGEVWIGGLAVAHGYFGRPELTAEKFLTQAGTRWYRTGDLGRLLPSGQVEILGRADASEININGTRVSLPEVLETLRARATLRTAWLSAVDQPGRHDPVLVAHCVPEEGTRFEASALREELTALLPSPAVPTLILPIEALPLTDNGKVDARRLEALAVAALSQPRAVPATDTDPHLPMVLEVAETVLGILGLTGGDNFFAVGGDSLKAVHFALGLSERANKEVATTLISNAESFADIAQALSSDTGAGFAAQMIREGVGDGPSLFTLNDRRRYEILAPQLTTEGAVWNLNMFGLSQQGLSDVDTFDLEELAGIFADEVLEKQPAGPWTLMAFCQSACLAIETARILQARTGAASHLVLVDAFFSEFLPTPRVHVLRFLDFGPGYHLSKVLRKLGVPARRLVVEDVPVQTGNPAALMSPNDKAMHQRFDRLCWAYQVTRYQGPVTLIVSKELRRHSQASQQKLVGPNPVVKGVDGLHMTVFQPRPNGRGLAQALDAVLRA